MQEYPDEVKEAFTEAHGDGKHLTNGERLKFQHNVAKDLLNKSYAHLVPELKDAVKGEGDIAMAEWDLALEDINLAEDVTRYDLLPSLFGRF